MDAGKLIISILVPQLAGILGSVATTPAIPTWYMGLKKPSFNPPNWVFAPVWTTLFLMMGISLYLVWNKAGDLKNVKVPLAIFASQLVLNILWSYLFFGLRSPFQALVEIIILWIAILFNTVVFFKISKPAGLLLVPYLAWVSFAAVLNFSIFRLNP